MADFNSVLKSLFQQKSASVGSDGSDGQLRASRRGQLLTANWKHELVMAGKVWRVTVGGITGGGDVNTVTGGGNGTTVDQDQPEAAIGVDDGYYLIPLEIKVAGHVDLDADADDGDIIAAVDRSAGVPTSVTGTIETPQNQLDGGASFPGRAFSAITGDIADPTVDEVLDHVHIQGGAAGTPANLAVAQLKMDYRAEFPDLIAGPCGLYVYWGGVAAVEGVASVLVAAVESNWFE